MLCLYVCWRCIRLVSESIVNRRARRITRSIMFMFVVFELFVFEVLFELLSFLIFGYILFLFVCEGEMVELMV